VIHGVGEVSGILKDGIQMGTLLAATFPPGSITGAPKIRAMQIIDEFENTPRGAYCGAIGYSSRCGRMALDVSIRTVELVPSNLDKKGPYSHELRYGAGCGIVAQSCPESEVDESWTKTALLARFITEQCRSVEADSSKNQLDDSSDSSERACASS
jgi:anthranilate/para-aminobenzoate synthase component I